MANSGDVRPQRPGVFPGMHRFFSRAQFARVESVSMPIQFLTKIFGSRNDRLLKTYRKTVTRINALEAQFEKLDDGQLQSKTAEFRQRLANGETLDALLPEAFATVRE
ncbi:hypothetical protein RZS08_21965, partial [Arthrospira platensis SPKY1]|nr:hypothetical protein [Arthrospira platensis SPKY1]